MVLKRVRATKILLEAKIFKIICMIMLKKFNFFNLTYISIIYLCFFVVLKQIQIVLKILTAAAILLAASLFKMVCIIMSKKRIFILTYLSIIYICFFVVFKKLQIGFKSPRAGAILLGAVLFKMVCKILPEYLKIYLITQFFNVFSQLCQNTYILL